MIFMYQQGGKIGHSTSFSSHLLPRVHGVLGATFSGRRVGGTIQSGVKLNISIWFSEIVTRSVGFWHTSTTVCLETEVLSAQVSGMFSNRPYLPIHFQVLVVLYTSSTCFQDLSGCDFGTGSVFCSHKKRLHMAEMPITTVPHAHHLFENQRARLVWIRVQVEIRIQYIYGHPYYIYTYVYSYNILLYIDIYIYMLWIAYIYTIQEAGEKPLSFQTAHGIPIQARKLIIESHAARWCRESFAGAPIATGSPSRFGEDKFHVFLVFSHAYSTCTQSLKPQVKAAWIQCRLTISAVVGQLNPLITCTIQPWTRWQCLCLIIVSGFLLFYAVLITVLDA